MRFLALAPLKFKNHEVKAGDTFTPKNEDAIRPLIDNARVRPVRDVLAERYRELCLWLKSYPVIADDIQQHLPELYQKIQDAIAEMDNCFLNENLQGFNQNMGKVKSLYLQAMTQVNQIELTKLTRQES